jgi:predicted alpha/beta superfamily hydrolase
MNTSHHNNDTLRVQINIILISLFLLVNLTSYGYAQIQDASSMPPQVEIAGTQVLSITSSICSQEYVLFVNLPRGYSDTTKSFPVLFLIDAQWDFPLVQAIYGEQYYDGFVPGIVIVGITWGGKNPDYDKLRARDLTPSDVSHTGQYGNAPNFLAFITKELVPFIEAKFRVKKNERTLVGSSFGGLFTLYAMFQGSTAFNRYVLTSPALGWDNEILSSSNKKYAEAKKDLPAKVFMGIGEFENVPEFQKFVNELQARNYKGFELQTKVLEGMGHSGGKAEGYSRGLQFVYAKQPVSIAQEVLDQYIGQYEVNPQYHVKIEREGNQLVGIAPNSPRMIIYAETEKDFYVKGQYLFIHFQKDSAGKVTGLKVEQYGGETLAMKVK